MPISGTEGVLRGFRARLRRSLRRQISELYSTVDDQATPPTIPIFFIVLLDSYACAASCLEHIGDLSITHGLFREGKGAVFPHLSGSAEKRAQSGA